LGLAGLEPATKRL